MSSRLANAVGLIVSVALTGLCAFFGIPTGAVALSTALFLGQLLVPSENVFASRLPFAVLPIAVGATYLWWRAWSS